MFLPLESIQSLSPCTLRSALERYLSKFSATSDVRYCVLKPILRRSVVGTWRPIYGKSRVNWKLKISNAADNADITQSQARDTKHRRMQEVNSFCTDSELLRANIALCHSTQCSLLCVQSIICFPLTEIILQVFEVCHCRPSGSMPTPITGARPPVAAGLPTGVGGA